MNDHQNDEGEQRSHDPENRDHLGRQGQANQNQGYAAQRELGNPESAILAPAQGFRRLRGFEPPNIFRARIATRFRERISHEVDVKARLPRPFA